MYGATRVSKASTAEGCESRGNSTIHCRHGLKMQGAGKLVTASEAQQEERGTGETREIPSGSATGSDFKETWRTRPGAERTMHGSVDLRGYQGIDGPVGNRI
jgi:hypothetical protein